MSFLVFVLASFLATSNAVTEVTATRLDGTTATGALQSWKGLDIVVVSIDGPVKLSASELLSVRWANSPIAVADSPLLPEVVLLDGTCIPINDFHRDGDNAVLTLRGPMPTDEQVIAMPIKSVAAVRLQPLQGSAAEQWDEIRKNEFAGDVLVVLNRNGQSLDYLEGKLGNVTAEHVVFQLDDKATDVNRSKVAGLIYYRAKKSPPKEPPCVVHGRDGLRAIVALASLQNRMLQMTTAAGVPLRWPMDDVHMIDFSAGKMHFLSDIEPVSENWTPLVGLPAGATIAATYGQPHRDQSAFGGPLRLFTPTDDSHATTGRTESYAKGLAIRSRTELVYRLPPAFKQLLGIAGIEPSARREGTARLTIMGDDRSLFDSEIAGDQPPVHIELDVTGVKRLKIVVDYDQNLDTGDWLNLCDLRIVK